GPRRPRLARGGARPRYRSAARPRGLGGAPPPGPFPSARAHGLRAQGLPRDRGGGDVHVVPALVGRGPAVSGTEPIPNAVPHLAGNEWAYLKECLDTNWVSSAGPFIERFERAVAGAVGAPHAIATVNGT